MPDFVSLAKKALMIGAVVAVGLLVIKLGQRIPVVGPYLAKLDA